ncbi:MAG: hypothetical protein PHS95_01580 [Candidatus Pacebacteria bacterium]|nr:hypothetical protein [Candidatus Paceibacterota bacterium]
MIEIIPAVMPKNYRDLTEKSALFAGVVPLVQFDIMDGKFVKARTWPYGPADSEFARIISEEEKMPEWETLNFEVDLMIENPEESITKWVKAGAKRIIVHVEGVKNFDAIRNAIPPFFIELGLAINPETPISTLQPYLDRVDFVQCMGIAKIGFQGEPFDERVLENIKALRKLKPEFPISVDGGVNFDTAKQLVNAGATRLVSGSAILQSADVSNAIGDLRNLVE